MAALKEKLFEAYGSAPTTAQTLNATKMIIGELISIAKEASVFANQYRDFNVGGVVLGLRFKNNMAENPWAVLFDANTKPTKDGDSKWCAEQYLMDRAESVEEEIDQILSFVVVGEPQTNDDSKKTQATLTPCKLCRDRMLEIATTEDESRNMAFRISLKTEVVTAHIENTGLRKYQRVEDLLTFHGEYAEID